MAQYFTTLHDPVHGTIDLTDFSGKRYQGAVKRALNAPMLRRLRHVKQLGHVSYSYIGADHSRFAHSLGTMQVARLLVAVLEEGHPDCLKSFQARFTSAFEGQDAEPFAVLAEHTMLAALLQDVGELPYEAATKLVCSPSLEVREFVSSKVGFDVAGWEAKDIFTIASLYEDENRDYLDGIDLPLLGFLATGKNHPWEAAEPEMRAWLHMLDGELDADRLDYVYRDAHHTVGGRGTPLSVVNTLLRYEAAGPVLSDVGPVVDFLATRALLWHTVYLSAANRFRRLLLALLLREALAKDSSRSLLEDFNIVRELTFENFRLLDDTMVETALQGLASHRKSRNELSRRARRALELLVDSRVDYGFLWILRSQAKEGLDEDVSGDGKFRPPPELFYDTYSELYYHWLYEPASIRVETASLEHLGSPVPIDTFGLFGEMLEAGWPSVPIPRGVQVFVPDRKDGKDWEEFERRLHGGTLHSALIADDLLKTLEIPTDTRHLPGFKGPAIFVSFRWKDINTVDEVLRTLFRRRCRYYALRAPFQGLGRTPSTNSQVAVQQAEAVIVVASKAYVESFRQSPTSNIAIEVNEMVKRRDEVPITFLSVDPYALLEDGLPWPSLGYSEVPFVGDPLKGKPESVVDAAVDMALTVIEQWHQR
jgi:HD superfamily phosphohydrolase